MIKKILPLFFGLLALSLTAQHCPDCQALKEAAWKKGWDGQAFQKSSLHRLKDMDVLSYALELELLDPNKRFLKGKALLRIQLLRKGLKEIELDLQGLKVQTVKVNGKKRSFTHNDPLLLIRLPKKYSLKNPIEVEVQYEGAPQEDKSWGGFYFEQGFAYNMGVGFADNPHNYGRIWFPCVDNFQDKSTYSISLITKDSLAGYANGLLVEDRLLTNGLRKRSWEQKEAIPSYLAAIAVANYSDITQAFAGINSTIPIALVVPKKDSQKAVASFIHLPQALSAFEYWFGPYRWSKVGFCMVPFEAGAMEHASLIAYPLYAVDGSLKQERLMAHELSHHWWGNLVTCAKAEDMWINEGFASYCEFLFKEACYGRKEALPILQKNLAISLYQAPKREGGHRPVAAVPWAHTYGSHVYKKGSLVAHNLRHYLGDSLFRQGMQAVMDSFAYKNLSTADFCQFLSKELGQDMQPFFKNWLWQAGWPSLHIVEEEIGANSIRLSIEQQLIGRDSLYEKLPLKVRLFLANGEYVDREILLSKKKQQFHWKKLAAPVVYAWINPDQSLVQARFEQFFEDWNSQQQELSLLQIKDFRFKRPCLAAEQLHLAYYPAAEGEAYWQIRGRIKGASVPAELALKQPTPSARLYYRTAAGQDWLLYPHSGKSQEGYYYIEQVLLGDYKWVD